jgi:hypothetical protein
LGIEEFLPEGSNEKRSVGALLEELEYQAPSSRLGMDSRSGADSRVQPAPGRVNVFYVYARRDSELRDELDKRLRPLERNGLVSGWSDGLIDPGKDWDKEIRDALSVADVVLLLVSPDFTASNYINSVELGHAMERHREGRASVIPIMLRVTPGLPESLTRLQALPDGAVPVVKWNDPDDAYKSIFEGVERVVRRIVATRRW